MLHLNRRGFLDDSITKLGCGAIPPVIAGRRMGTIGFCRKQEWPSRHQVAQRRRELDSLRHVAGRDFPEAVRQREAGRHGRGRRRGQCRGRRHVCTTVQPERQDLARRLAQARCQVMAAAPATFATEESLAGIPLRRGRLARDRRLADRPRGILRVRLHGGRRGERVVRRRHRRRGLGGCQRHSQADHRSLAGH